MSVFKLAGLYRGLLALRLVITILFTGYIHPDEFFQAPEVVSRDVFAYSSLFIPWEFVGASPCRSVLAPHVLAGPPLYIIAVVTNVFGVTVPSWYMYLLIRLYNLALSLVLDWTIYRVTHTHGMNPYPALVILASSHVTVSFQTRPFSNSLESLVLSVALWAVTCIPGTWAPECKGRSLSPIVTFHYRDRILGVLLAVGIFIRFTLLLYFAPIALYVALQVWRVHHHHHHHSQQQQQQQQARPSRPLADPPGYIQATWATVSYILTVPGLSFLVTCGCLALLDSWYFDHPTLTPWNSLVYNANPANLALHGLHPRWLHIVVNMQLMYLCLGPVPVVIAAYLALRWVRGKDQEWQWEWNTLASVGDGGKGKAPGKRGSGRDLQWLCARGHTTPRQHVIPLCLAICLCAVFFLSLAPHQEARFLTAALVPVTLLASSVYPCTTRFPRLSGLLIALWIMGNVGAVTFYSGIHQAGVVPASTWLQQQLQHSVINAPPHLSCNSTISVYYWRTFMPPRFLLQLPPAPSPSSSSSSSSTSVHGPSFEVVDIGEWSDDRVTSWLTQGNPQAACPAYLVAPNSRATPELVLLSGLQAVWTYKIHFSAEDPPSAWDRVGISVFIKQ